MFECNLNPKIHQQSDRQKMKSLKSKSLLTGKWQNLQGLTKYTALIDKCPVRNATRAEYVDQNSFLQGAERGDSDGLWFWGF